MEWKLVAGQGLQLTWDLKAMDGNGACLFRKAFYDLLFMRMNIVKSEMHANNEIISHDHK